MQVKSSQIITVIIAFLVGVALTTFFLEQREETGEVTRIDFDQRD